MKKNVEDYKSCNNFIFWYIGKDYTIVHGLLRLKKVLRRDLIGCSAKRAVINTILCVFQSEHGT